MFKINDSDKYIFACREDYPEIITLWREAFHDSVEDIEEFLRDYFTPQRILLYKENQKTIAMASLFPVNFGNKNAVYIYALAVDSAFRGNGIASGMLRFVQTIYDCDIIVQPEPTGVEKFYEKLGFTKLPADPFWDLCEEYSLCPLTLGKSDALILSYDSKKDFQFKALTAKDVKAIYPYFSLRSNKSCDSTPLSLFLYRHSLETHFYVDDLACYYFFLLPGPVIAAGLPNCKPEDLPEAFHRQEKFFNDVLHIPHRLFNVDAEGVSALSAAGALYQYSAQESGEYTDYIYTADSLRTLAGKKLHKKLNHIHQLENAFQGRWEYVRLSYDSKAELIRFLENWTSQHTNNGKIDSFLLNETAGIVECFDEAFFFDLFSFGGIRIDGELKAISIGAYNPLEKMAVIDVEKADNTFSGLYQLINREFLLHEFPDAQIVNREDDAGNEGIRAAKLSYYPSEYAVKFNLNQLL